MSDMLARVFIDSSVLFSAAYSNKGHARDLIMLAAREEIRHAEFQAFTASSSFST
jgi:predicted nucleic acid-binding protein